MARRYYLPTSRVSTFDRLERWAARFRQTFKRTLNDASSNPARYMMSIVAAFFCILGIATFAKGLYAHLIITPNELFPWLGRMLLAFALATILAAVNHVV